MRCEKWRGLFNIEQPNFLLADRLAREFPCGECCVLSMVTPFGNHAPFAPTCRVSEITLVADGCAGRSQEPIDTKSQTRDEGASLACPPTSMTLMPRMMTSCIRQRFRSYWCI